MEKKKQGRRKVQQYWELNSNLNYFSEMIPVLNSWASTWYIFIDVPEHCMQLHAIKWFGDLRGIALVSIHPFILNMF